MGQSPNILGPGAKAAYTQQRAAALGPSHIAKRVKAGIRSSNFAADEFLNILAKAGLPHPAREFKFNPERQWRADFCWFREKLILEVDGGVFVGGGHNSGGGFVKDIEKLNSAAILGFRVIRVQPAHLLLMETVALVERALKGARRT